MNFQIGDVVYPSRGVGTIENISTRSFGSHSRNSTFSARLQQHDGAGAFF
jgi:RNA polymerase-interacting CarD/CdnL/TRCF family regulator